MNRPLRRRRLFVNRLRCVEVPSDRIGNDDRQPGGCRCDRLVDGPTEQPTGTTGGEQIPDFGDEPVGECRYRAVEGHVRSVGIALRMWELVYY